MIDGYHKWLGIPKDLRPPTHYQLLGIAPDENDPEVIEAAAVRQVGFVRNFQSGPHAEQCSRILTELAEARLTLLNPTRRRQYDARLTAAAKPAVAPPQNTQNPTKDELAHLNMVLTDVRIDPTERSAGGDRRGKRGQSKGWSPLAIALQCGITGFTLVAAYYLLDRWPRTPAPPIVAKARTPSTPAPVAAPSQSPKPSVASKPAQVPEAASAEEAEKVTPAPAELDIRSSPPQVTLKLEGLNAGYAESRDGVHRFRLPEADGVRTVRARGTLAGYKPVEETLTPLPGERRTLTLILVPDGSTEESTAQLGSVLPLPPVPAPGWAVFKIHLEPVPKSLTGVTSGLKAKSYRIERGLHLYHVPAPDGTSPIKFHYSAPGFKPLETSLTPQPGERQDLIFHLAPTSSTDESRVIIDREASSPAPQPRAGTRRELKVIDQELRRFDGMLARIQAVAITPDGKRALSAGADGRIRVYDPESGRLIRTINAHKDAVLALAIAPGGRQVLSAGVDPVIRHWEIASGHSTGVVFTGCAAPVVCVAFTPRGDNVCAGDALGFHLWNDAGDVSAQRFPLAFQTPVVALAVAPQNDSACVARGDRIIECSFKGATTCRQVGSTLSDARLTALDIAPDGRLLALGCGDGTLRLWDRRTGEEVRRFEKHDGRVNSAQFSSNGKTVVSGGGTDDPTIRLWDVNTGAEVARFKGHTQAVTRVIFTPGDRRLLSGSIDRTVRLWDIPN